MFPGPSSETMNPMINPLGSILGALTLVLSVAHADTVTVQNRRLAVTYDTTAHQFALKDRATGQTILSEGQLLNAPVTRAQAKAVKNPVFGAGRQIEVRYGDGGISTLELYPTLPFLLVSTEMRNSGTAPMDIEHVVPVQFKMDLGKPIAQLRTMGTAGLTAPDKNPGSYLFLTLADPATRRGVVAGWLTQERGSGVLFSEADGAGVKFRGQIDYGHLRLDPGASSTLETLAVGVFDDARLGEEGYADALARQYHIQLRPQTTGYCTWYSNPHGGAADEKSIVELAEVAARELKPFGFSFVQIDDKWQDGQERNGPARRFWRVKPDGPYAHGLEPVSQKLKDLGLTTGLWFLPFASDYLDPEFKDRQHWFMKRQDGKPYETPWGNTSLDLTHPEVREYLANLFATL